jgi:hypothetical protein
LHATPVDLIQSPPGKQHPESIQTRTAGLQGRMKVASKSISQQLLHVWRKFFAETSCDHTVHQVKMVWAVVCYVTTPSSLACEYQRFGGNFLLYLQGRDHV